MIKIVIGNKKKGAACVIENSGTFLLLLRPTNSSWAPGQWAFAGGKLEPGETSLEAVIREVKEETGLDISNPKYLKNCSNKAVDTYYCDDYTGNVVIDFEHDDFRWVRPDELGDYDLAPDVEKTIHSLA